MEKPATPVLITRPTLAASSSGPDAARLVIGIDRQIDRVAQQGQMLQHIVAGDRIVRTADRPRKAGAAGGEGHQSQMLQETGTADIPRIGKHETAFLMERAEGSAFFGNVAGHGEPRFLF